MERDDLHQLLRQTDDATPSPRASGNVARAVRRRHAQRKRNRVRVVGAALLLFVGVGVWQVAGPFKKSGSDATKSVALQVPQEATSKPVDLDVVRKELADLNRQAESAEAAVDRLLVVEQRRHAVASRTSTPSVDLVWQREEAALVLVHQGERLSRELNLPAPAAVAYRQASETFPDTRWGEVARERLAMKLN